MKILKTNFIISIMIAIAFLLKLIFTQSIEWFIQDEMIQVIIGMFQIFWILFIAIFFWLNLLCLPIYIAKAIRLIVNKRYIDKEESVYTRELPEEYNSVIAGEILDLKSRFKQEYVAGVIELISKGYIIEDGEKLIVNNEIPTDNLLKNEKYILQTCNESACYGYEFFKVIQEDMLDLGLYKEKKFFKNVKNRIKYILEKEKKNTKIKLISSIIIFVILMGIPISIFSALFYNFKLTCAIIILFYTVIIIMIRKNRLTKKGEIEKERIGKLKLFFDKETNFKDKTTEERKIWGRYSAFAVALGVNKEVKNEILKKILNNTLL